MRKTVRLVGHGLVSRRPAEGPVAEACRVHYSPSRNDPVGDQRLSAPLVKGGDLIGDAWRRNLGARSNRSTPLACEIIGLSGLRQWGATKEL